MARTPAKPAFTKMYQSVPRFIILGKIRTHDAHDQLVLSGLGLYETHLPIMANSWASRVELANRSQCWPNLA